MNWVALRMLTGDPSKYLGIVFGVTFATLLMSQQMSIFVGIMARTGSQIADVSEADIWVMDSKVRFIDEIPALPQDTLQRVVNWYEIPVPLFRCDPQNRGVWCDHRDRGTGSTKVRAGRSVR